MVTLRRQEKSFDIRAQSFHQLCERSFVRIADYSILFRENLDLNEIVSLAGPLQDHIKTMNRRAAGAEKFGDGIKTFRKRIALEMLEDRD